MGKVIGALLIVWILSSFVGCLDMHLFAALHH